MTWNRPLYYNRLGQPLGSLPYEDEPDQQRARTLAYAQEWGKDRTVGATQVGCRWVSTVFLVIDHAVWPGSPPLLFETMVFLTQGDSDGEFDQRYHNEAEAIMGHCAVVAALRTRYELPPARKELTT